MAVVDERGPGGRSLPLFARVSANELSLRCGQRHRERDALLHFGEEARDEFGAASVDDLPERKDGSRVSAGL